jgi:hypothetical protein
VGLYLDTGLERHQTAVGETLIIEQARAALLRTRGEMSEQDSTSPRGHEQTTPG